MRNVLIVKLSSMGDVIHTLPAITDAVAMLGDVRFDWVVDEGFKDIPTWHSSVNRIITTEHRKWRKSWYQYYRNGEIKKSLQALREHKYDVIIDAQGNIKSAIVALCARGKRHGLSFETAAENIASLTYHKRHAILKQQHAITRIRQLFAKSLGYQVPSTKPNYQLQTTSFIKPQIRLPENYLFFIPNASWQSKLWPHDYWLELITRATSTTDDMILIPAGNAEEMQRAQQMAAVSPQAIALPRMRLSEIAYILARAKGCVSVDTGLNHLAAALNIPTVSLYGSTDAKLIGAIGEKQHYLQSTLSCAPCYKRSCPLHVIAKYQPICLAAFEPKDVINKLHMLLGPVYN